MPTLSETCLAYQGLRLTSDHVVGKDGNTTEFGRLLFAYFAHRATSLNDFARTHLMNKDEASYEFERLRKSLNPKCPLPMNKQKGEKRKINFLTCMVNMLVEANIGNAPCNYDPRRLTTITRGGVPFRTLSRRVDGAFPSIINPLAIWEIKEYYHTTTFGSRVADGVYETLVDGMELEELEAESNRKIYHVLFVDAYYTWWNCGRSYLCRLVDMLHMGYVDEVIFGREVLRRLPVLARELKAQYRQLEQASKESRGHAELPTIR